VKRNPHNQCRRISGFPRALFRSGADPSVNIAKRCSSMETWVSGLVAADRSDTAGIHRHSLSRCCESAEGVSFLRSGDRKTSPPLQVGPRRKPSLISPQSHRIDNLELCKLPTLCPRRDPDNWCSGDGPTRTHDHSRDRRCWRCRYSMTIPGVSGRLRPPAAQDQTGSEPETVLLTVQPRPKYFQQFLAALVVTYSF